MGTLYYAGDWIPVRESSVKAPDKLGLSTVIVASNELCYQTNCSRWFYFFFRSMKPHGQWQFNETQLLGSAFLNKRFLLCCVRCTNDSKWRHQCKKKNSSCHSVAWYHWRSQKIGCICLLISNSVGNVNFTFRIFNIRQFYSKFIIEQNSFGFSFNLHILLLVYGRRSTQNINWKKLFVYWNVTFTESHRTRTHSWLRMHFVLIRRVKTMISADA